MSVDSPPLRIALALSGQLRSFFDPLQGLPRVGGVSLFDGIRQQGSLIDVYSVLPLGEPRIADFLQFWTRPPPGFRLCSTQLIDESGSLPEFDYNRDSTWKQEWHLGPNNVQAILRQHYAKSVVGGAVRQAEVLTGARYDWIVWARYDSKFLRLMEQLVDQTSALHVPRHDSYGGYCDRFAFGPSELMERYLQLYPAARGLWEGRNLMAEETLKAHLDACQIIPERTRAVIRVVRYGQTNHAVWSRELGDDERYALGGPLDIKPGEPGSP